MCHSAYRASTKFDRNARKTYSIQPTLINAHLQQSCRKAVKDHCAIIETKKAYLPAQLVPYVVTYNCYFVFHLTRLLPVSHRLGAVRGLLPRRSRPTRTGSDTEGELVLPRLPSARSTPH